MKLMLITLKCEYAKKVVFLSMWYSLENLGGFLVDNALSAAGTCILTGSLNILSLSWVSVEN